MIHKTRFENPMTVCLKRTRGGMDKLLEMDAFRNVKFKWCYGIYCIFFQDNKLMSVTYPNLTIYKESYLTDWTMTVTNYVLAELDAEFVIYMNRRKPMMVGNIANYYPNPYIYEKKLVINIDMVTTESNEKRKSSWLANSTNLNTEAL